MQIARTITELHEFRPQLGCNVGLVPTMGGLHEGHLALIRAAHEDNDAVLATIFLNPRQFTDDKDFAAYPRDLERDLTLLEDEAVDLVFTPKANEIYSRDFQTEVNVTDLSHKWEGSARPGHFQSVATIVTILLNLTQTQRAYFGQKDVQQVAVIRRLVQDLRIPVKTLVLPTVRANDGLAHSTRNDHLNEDERIAATGIFRALRKVSSDYDTNIRDASSLRESLWDSLRENRSIRVDYAEIVDLENFCRIQGELANTDTALAIVAIRIGDVRLIDNMLLPSYRNNRSDLSALLGVSL